MTALAYYRAGFPGALREVVAWLWHPPVWWAWLIAAPLWPFVAHVVLWYQLRHGDAWASKV